MVHDVYRSGIIAFLFLFMLSYSVTATAWSNSSYDKCKTINITNVGNTTLTDFPVYINLSYDNDMQTNFSDLIFYNTSCSINGSLLSFEVDSYIDSNSVNLWVRVPVFETGVSQISVFYKNNTPVLSLSDGVNTFTNYLTVHHFNNVNSTDSLNLINGTASGTITTTPGIIGGALNFTPPTGKINLGNDVLDVENLTVCVWVIVDTVSTSDQVIIRTGSENTNDWGLSVGGPVFSMFGRTASHATAASNANVITGRQYYLCGINSPEQLYLNGTLQIATRTDSYSQEVNTKLGSRGSAWPLDGILADMVIYDGILTGNWINQSYQQIINQVSYIMFSSEYSQPVPVAYINYTFLPEYAQCHVQFQVGVPEVGGPAPGTGGISEPDLDSNNNTVFLLTDKEATYLNIAPYTQLFFNVNKVTTSIYISQIDYVNKSVTFFLSEPAAKFTLFINQNYTVFLNENTNLTLWLYDIRNTGIDFSYRFDYLVPDKNYNYLINEYLTPILLSILAVTVSLYLFRRTTQPKLTDEEKKKAAILLASKKDKKGKKVQRV